MRKDGRAWRNRVAAVVMGTGILQASWLCISFTANYWCAQGLYIVFLTDVMVFLPKTQAGQSTELPELCRYLCVSS